MFKIREKIKAKEDITIQFLGDSITWGMNFCHPEETYVARIAQFIAKDLPDSTVRRFDGINEAWKFHVVGFDGPIYVKCGDGQTVDIIKNGVGGSNVERALDRFSQVAGEMPNGKTADLTVMMFGINDALKTEPTRYLPPEVFKETYRTLINKIRESDKETEFVMISPNWSDQSIEEHCKMAEELAKEENIFFIDMHKLWIDHYDELAVNFGQGDWLKSDPWHPTPLGTQKTAEYIYDKLKTVLF